MLWISTIALNFLFLHKQPDPCFAHTLQQGSITTRALRAAVAPYAAELDHPACCATADTQNGPASLAACAAKRWLARNAAGLKRIRSQASWQAEACISLVSCLPTLEDVNL